MVTLGIGAIPVPASKNAASKNAAFINHPKSILPPLWISTSQSNTKYHLIHVDSWIYNFAKSQNLVSPTHSLIH